MEKEKIDKYLNGNLDITDKKDKNSLYIEIAENISYGGKDEISSAIAAVKKIEEQTGKEPEFEPYVLGQPKRCLGQDVRDGYISPSEEAVELYKSTMQKEMPGLGEPSEQEIAYTDADIGFKSAGFQTGHKLSGPEKMVFEESKSENPEGVGARETDPVDMSFGPSKVIKGALTNNMEEVYQGLKETSSVAAGKTLEQSLNAVDKPTGLVSAVIEEYFKMVGSQEGGAITEKKLGTENKEKDESTLGIASQLANSYGVGKPLGVVSDIVEAFTGKQDGQNIAEKLKNDLIGLSSDKQKGNESGVGIQDIMGGRGNPLGSPKSTQEDKDKEDKTQSKGLENKGPEGMEQLAGWIARGITYSVARKRGLSPKDSGDMAEVAGKEAEEVTKGAADSMQNVNKALEGVKTAKNTAAKGLKAATELIPNPAVGKAVAIGVAIADKASDFIIDLVNNDGNSNKKVMDEVAGKGGEQKTTSSPLSQSSPEGATKSPTSNDFMSLDAFREQVTKEKRGLTKKLIPKEDLLASGAQTAINSVGSWGASEKQKIENPKQVEEFHKAIDGPA